MKKSKALKLPKGMKRLKPQSFRYVIDPPPPEVITFPLDPVPVTGTVSVSIGGRPESVLAEADRLINGDRQTDYGPPIDDFGKTAAMWTARLRGRGLLAPGAELQPEDVGWMMVDVKWSRELNAHKRDNLVDAAGYVGTVASIIDDRARRATEGKVSP